MSGSDLTDSSLLDALRARGRARRGRTRRPNAARTPTSSCGRRRSRSDNVELVAARERGATLLSRAEVLRRLAEARPVIGLTGTHGKTTATSMMVHVMAADGRDVGHLLGADVLGVGANGHWGSGDMVVEVDESYGTFALLSPHALGLLNVEADHLDHYGTLAALESAFAQFIDRTTRAGRALERRRGLSTRRASRARDVVRVGTRNADDWRVSDVALTRDGAHFLLSGPDAVMELALQVTGAHNVADAAVVAVLALTARRVRRSDRAGLGELSRCAAALRAAWARGGASTSTRATRTCPVRSARSSSATRAAGYERITAVFQPHRVTRTISLVDDFAPAFDLARTSS